MSLSLALATATCPRSEQLVCSFNVYKQPQPTHISKHSILHLFLSVFTFLLTHWRPCSITSFFPPAPSDGASANQKRSLQVVGFLWVFYKWVDPVNESPHRLMQENIACNPGNMYHEIVSSVITPSVNQMVTFSLSPAGH